MPPGRKEPDRNYVVTEKKEASWKPPSYQKNTARADDIIQLIGRKVISGKNITT